MFHSFGYASSAFIVTLVTRLSNVNAFAPTRFAPFVSAPCQRRSTANIHRSHLFLDQSSVGIAYEILAYTDDPVGDLLGGASGVVVGGILATVVAIGVGFTALLPSVGSAKFTLTEEEEDAISRVEMAYDSKKWEQELTEEGSKGYVNRRRQAVEAKERYQAGKSSVRDVKDKSLRYSEADLGFIACLIRAAKPNAGDVLIDLGSGAGRSTLGCAAIFPGFKKCIGIEFLDPLVKLANGYKGKVQGKKAPVEFRVADFAEEDLSEANVVFVAGTYLSDMDVRSALSTVKSGTKVMTIDRRLGSGFMLATQVDDPSGDLMLNTGFVYQKL